MSMYIDIHSHIMPGVDDGAHDLKESIAMLRIAEREGICKIILTPHQKPDRKCVSKSGMEKRIVQLQSELERLHMDIALYPGSELLYSKDLVERLTGGYVCTLAGSHYILVEFLPNEDWIYIRDGIYELACAGYWPILAHVERYVQFHERTERIQELIDMGCYIQVNVGSLMGENGWATKWYCGRLIEKHLVHFIATDAHRDSGKRTPQMRKCAQWLTRKAGSDYAERLLWKNAEYILADTEL